MKKKIRRLLGVLLGFSIMAATTAASNAESMFIHEGAAEDDPNIVCPDGYERVPYDGGVAFKSKVAEIPDLTVLTPVEHNEYMDGNFYIVDDIYVQTGEPTDLFVNNASEWEYKKVTVNRSIYDNPDKSYGTLFATMTITAQFKWNGETAWVVGDPNCYTKIESAGEKFIIDNTDKSKVSRSDQGSNFLFGNKFAYVEYIVTLTYHFDVSGFPDELPVDFRLYVSVNRNGSMNTEN